MANEYVENCKKMLKVFEERPWLFRKNDLVQVSEYLAWFEKKTKKSFFVFPTMLPFDVAVLDQFEEQIFNTFFLPGGNGNLSMHTVVQVSPTFHILWLYGYSPDGAVVVYATLYTSDPLDYRDFMVQQQAYFHEDQKPLGFGVASPVVGVAYQPSGRPVTNKTEVKA
jgi:hypothetical protein